MISLWQDPKGEKVFSTNDTTDNSVIGDKTKIVQLEQEILSLKQQLNNPCAHSSDHVRKYWLSRRTNNYMSSIRIHIEMMKPERISFSPTTKYPA